MFARGELHLVDDCVEKVIVLFGDENASLDPVWNASPLPHALRVWIRALLERHGSESGFILIFQTQFWISTASGF
jgi:hypothetical protein